MKDVEKLIDAIKLTIYTGYLKNIDKPNSLLIIAKPESGKTEAMKKFVINRNIAYLSDVTAHGIERDILSKIETREVRFIMIPDLLKPLGRKESTVRTFIAFMNSLIEEGVVSLHTYAMDRTYAIPVRCGLITAITGEELKDQRHCWGRLGFLSRIIPFSYSYGMNTVRGIFDSIIKDEFLAETNCKLKIPKKDKEIALPKRYAERIIPAIQMVAQAQESYGFRLQKQFQGFLKASALEEGRSEVNEGDVKRVLSLMDWINFDEHPFPPSI